MGEHPRAARNAAIKCILCDAPVIETDDGTYVCAECGRTPVRLFGSRESLTPAEGD